MGACCILGGFICMKALTITLYLCASFVVTMIWYLPKTKILGPIAARFHIPAPDFTLNEIIRAACLKHKVKPAFVKSIIRAESGFSPVALSPKGAVGLMQLMPATAREYGADPHVPAQNVEAGTHYVSWLLNRYSARRDQMKRAIAAYNAGPGNVDRYHGVPPFRETRAYVARVLKYYKQYQTVAD
jgi:soluble lytic murein transglycosylase-like protein